MTVENLKEIATAAELSLIEAVEKVAKEDTIAVVAGRLAEYITNTPYPAARHDLHPGEDMDRSRAAREWYADAVYYAKHGKNTPTRYNSATDPNPTYYPLTPTRAPE